MTGGGCYPVAPLCVDAGLLSCCRGFGWEMGTDESVCGGGNSRDKRSVAGFVYDVESLFLLVVRRCVS